MRQDRKDIVCQTLEKETSKNNETQQKLGDVRGKCDPQQIATQKGKMAKELRQAVTLLVQCQLATNDMIDSQETFVADILGDFLHVIDSHKDALIKLQEVYK